MVLKNVDVDALEHLNWNRQSVTILPEMLATPSRIQRAALRSKAQHSTLWLRDGVRVFGCGTGGVLSGSSWVGERTWEIRL